MSDDPKVSCEECGATNLVPPEALRLGRFRCHACGEEQAVPPWLREPDERPEPVPEPSHSGPTFTPSRYNNPEAMRRAEEEASKVGCLLALFGWLG